MNSSPIQLEHYFVAECHSEARTDPPGEDQATFGPAESDQFKTDVRMYQGEDEPDVYQIQLVITSREDAEPEPLYNLRLHIVGFFRVSPNFKHEHLEHLVQANGASVLYSAARDFVLTLTSRGPWGPIMLPTVNFRIGQRAPEPTGVAEDSKS